jgi:hypothetical protein
MHPLAGNEGRLTECDEPVRAQAYWAEDHPSLAATLLGLRPIAHIRRVLSAYSCTTKVPFTSVRPRVTSAEPTGRSALVAERWVMIVTGGEGAVDMKMVSDVEVLSESASRSLKAAVVHIRTVSIEGSGTCG